MKASDRMVMDNTPEACVEGILRYHNNESVENPIL